jgi:prepilin-type N-terminal cleavage/methylation domain-containing protein
MKTRGFTLIEILITVGILGAIVTIILVSFNTFRDSQGLERETETVVEILNQARSQTLSSKNASSYGVHFASTSVTFFTGTTYNAADSTNQIYSLTSNNIINSVNLTPGGMDVVFNRLTGETNQNGTIGLLNQRTSASTTITIYKTGLIEYE